MKNPEEAAYRNTWELGLLLRIKKDPNPLGSSPFRNIL